MLTSFSPSTCGASGRLLMSVRAPCTTSCCDFTLFDAFQSSTRSKKTLCWSEDHLSGAGKNWAPLSDSSPSSAPEVGGFASKTSPLSSPSGGDMMVSIWLGGNTNAADRWLAAMHHVVHIASCHP